MLTRPQQILLKRAQREAALPDDEYRAALEIVAGVRFSKDAAMTDRHLDFLLGYFEAIHWRKIFAGELQPSSSAAAVFRQRSFWARRNTRLETSRDRFTRSHIEREIAEFESALARLGFDKSYCDSIRSKVTRGRLDSQSQFHYIGALKRTLAAKSGKAGA